MGIINLVESAKRIATTFRIEQVSCSSVDEFLKQLSPHGPQFFQEDSPIPWVFRGHSDIRFSLTPSALRDDRPLRFFSKDAGAADTEASQIVSEIEAVSSFFFRTDRDGLAIPGDSTELRNFFEKLSDSNVGLLIQEREIEWPPDEILPLLAVCQHHGLPTRLLDWSHSPNIAAYFAAAGTTSLSRSDVKKRGQVSVWALSMVAVKLKNAFLEVNKENPLKFITVPTATNQNLHAQKGLFTLFRRAIVNPDAPVDRSPLDETLAKEAEETSSDPTILPTMYHFTLPASEAKQLLFALAKQGVDGSSLFPGYDGVVRGLRETQFWQRPKYER